MRCPACGTELSVGTQACPHCGLVVRTSGTKFKSGVLAPLLIAFGSIVILGVMSAAAILLAFRARFRANPFYQESLAIARSSPDLQSVLGQPIEEDWFTFGSTEHVYGSDFAEWTASLKGPKGGGRLHGVANRIGASWHYSRLLFSLDAPGKTVDITPPPVKDILLSRESQKKMFLVPLGAVREEYLAWAPAYYKAKFGLDVEVLPIVPLNASVWSAQRHQLIAENLIALMKQALPERTKDQWSILIGVTASDMYIESYDWNYAINDREDGRYGVVSTARLQPIWFSQKWNQALAVSRLQKMITKNVYLLCFDVPLSSDYTSAVSGGVMSPAEVDYMSDQVIGAEGQWHSLLAGVVPAISAVLVPGQPVAWNMDWSAKPPIDLSSEYFAANLWAGPLIQRKTDFYLDGGFPLQFVRAYASNDRESREFGVGTNDSLDISIAGVPGKYLELTLENGVQTHFDRDPPSDRPGKQAYRGRADYFSIFSGGRILMQGYDSDLETREGWHYFFPYRPTAKTESKYAVLTGYSDLQGHRYEMQRNDIGELLSVTTPAGKWLHFESDQQHRFRRLEDSEGRVVNYDYDPKGRLVRVSDSEGKTELYRYDDQNQMVAVLDAEQHALLTVTYSPDRRIASETLSDGRRFQYDYQTNATGNVSQIRFTDPRGYVTVFHYVGKEYTQSLPSRTPDERKRAPEPFLD
jgi:YD repeat-containing protein